MKWLNVLGLIFQFFAFWFAAPELLGGDTLKRFEKGLISFVSKMPSILLALLAIVFGTGMSIFGIQQGISATENNASNMIGIMIFILVISAVTMAYFIFFSRRTQHWMQRRYAQPFIEKLIQNGESRKSALIIGAILFTVGFILQLMVALLS